MNSPFCILSDLLFDASILDHAIQQPRARHQDVIALLLPEAKCRLRLGICMFKIAIIQMQISVAEMDAPQSVMISILLVNRRSLFQLRERLCPQLFEAASVLSFTSVLARAPFRSGFAAARCIRVDFPAKLQCDKPFYVGKIIEGACNVSMAWVSLTILIDGCGEI